MYNNCYLVSFVLASLRACCCKACLRLHCVTTWRRILTVNRKPRWFCPHSFG